MVLTEMDGSTAAYLAVGLGALGIVGFIVCVLWGTGHCAPTERGGTMTCCCRGATPAMIQPLAAVATSPGTAAPSAAAAAAAAPKTGASTTAESTQQQPPGCVIGAGDTDTRLAIGSS